MYGKRLKELRKEKRLTIEDVAKELGIAKSTYAGYEVESRKPDVYMLASLSDFYDVSIDYIIGVTDERDIKRLEYDASEYLKKHNLNWNGVPLTDEQLKPIRELLEMIVRDKLPKHKENRS